MVSLDFPSQEEIHLLPFLKKNKVTLYSNADDATKADNHYVNNAVNALFKGEPIMVPGTKAVGCATKRETQ